MAGKTRKAKKEETFDFTYEGKRYVIRHPYQAQPATLVLSDGKILHVRQWKLVPTEPQPDMVGTFDPEKIIPADLAREQGGLLAELAE
jgi:hypothetical protein